MCKRCRKRCRKRFTYKPAFRGLSEEKRELIAELLWLEVTVAGAAKRVGVHPKTVAKYYRHIRKYIAAELDKLTAQRPITSPHSTASTTDASTTTTTKSPWSTASNGLETFRGYTKRRLKSDHGGFKRSFRLFIRE